MRIKDCVELGYKIRTNKTVKFNKAKNRFKSVMNCMNSFREILRNCWFKLGKYLQWSVSHILLQNTKI